MKLTINNLLIIFGYYGLDNLNNVLSISKNIQNILSEYELLYFKNLCDKDYKNVVKSNCKYKMSSLTNTLISYYPKIIDYELCEKVILDDNVNVLKHINRYKNLNKINNKQSIDEKLDSVCYYHGSVECIKYLKTILKKKKKIHVDFLVHCYVEDYYDMFLYLLNHRKMNVNQKLQQYSPSNLVECILSPDYYQKDYTIDKKIKYIKLLLESDKIKINKKLVKRMIRAVTDGNREDEESKLRYINFKLLNFIMTYAKFRNILEHQ